MKFQEDYVRNLPDAFCKEPGCNNEKLLRLNAEIISQIRQDIQAVDDANDLDKASGKTLDLYGEVLNQPRGQMNDIQYRYLLYTKIGANSVSGDYFSTMRCLMQLFRVDPDDPEYADFMIVEDDLPGVVRLEKMPLHVLAGAGFTSKQAVQMIEKLLPVGVKVFADEFEGTLEFAETHTEYDEKAGFADNDQTLGGWFGLLFGEDGETPLPL